MLPTIFGIWPKCSKSSSMSWTVCWTVSESGVFGPVNLWPHTSRQINRMSSKSGQLSMTWRWSIENPCWIIWTVPDHYRNKIISFDRMPQTALASICQLDRVRFLSCVLSQVNNTWGFFWYLFWLFINLVPPTRKFIFRHLVRIKRACMLVVCTHHLLLITRVSDDPCRDIPPWSKHRAQICRWLQAASSRISHFDIMF